MQVVGGVKAVLPRAHQGKALTFRIHHERGLWSALHVDKTTQAKLGCCEHPREHIHAVGRAHMHEHCASLAIHAERRRRVATCAPVGRSALAVDEQPPRLKDRTVLRSQRIEVLRAAWPANAHCCTSSKRVEGDRTLMISRAPCTEHLAAQLYKTTGPTAWKKHPGVDAARQTKVMRPAIERAHLAITLRQKGELIATQIEARDRRNRIAHMRIADPHLRGPWQVHAIDDEARQHLGVDAQSRCNEQREGGDAAEHGALQLDEMLASHRPIVGESMCESRRRSSMRATCLLPALTMLFATSAEAQQVIVVTHPSPAMRPPVLVVPGQYVPTPPRAEVVIESPGVQVGAQLPVCPPDVPCTPLCPPMVPCPPPPCVCAANVVLAPMPAQAAYAQPIQPTTQPTTPSAPVIPAPGTLQLAYTGAFDGASVLHGGAFRFTGHIEDVWFIEAEIGGKGAPNLGEFQFALGPRVMAPIIPSVMRLYGTLATGIIVRAIGDRNSWGIWPLQLGGGIEVGAPLTENWSIGGFIDVRGELRVPFERDPVSLGFTWSAGAAFMWF